MCKGVKTIEMKRPSELLSGYFYNNFGKINENMSHR